MPRKPLPQIPSLQMPDGLSIPQLGLGTWQLTGKACVNAVCAAFSLGIKHVDTAELYGNQKEIGKAIIDSGIDRADVFITSKVWHSNLSRSKAIAACEATLKQLNTDYLDLYLIHWPNKEVPVGETLAAMEILQKEGKIRSIGVSNFTIAHLKEAAEHSTAKIATNQVEFHPYLYQKELLEYCKSKGIILTAYSPLAHGAVAKDGALKELGERYGKSAVQVALRWLVQHGMAVIPKMSSEEHMLSNLDVFSWKLLPSDMKKIDGMDKNKRVINPWFAEFERE